MKKISKLLNQLIELSSVISQIENRSTVVEITSKDLDIFYEFSILSITDIERVITESLIENTLEKHKVVLNKIKEKLIIYNDFKNKHPRILENINLRNLIEDKLSVISHQIDNAKFELDPIDNELYDLKGTISASAYSKPESVTEMLVEKETILKNKAEPIRKKYINLQKQKREQEIFEIQRYSQINFKNIEENFKKIIALCKVESHISEKKTEHEYVKFSIILQIHEAFIFELFKDINSEKLNELFNLSEENLVYIIPKGYKTKFYYLIRILNEYVVKKTNYNWKDSILKKLKIKESTYTSGSSKLIKSANRDDKDFATKVNNIFSRI